MTYAGSSRSRLWMATAVTVTAAIALTGCSGGGAEDGKTTVTFSYLWGGAEAEALEVIIDNFNESQDDIEVVGVSSPDTQKQLTSMSSSNGSFDISDNFGNTVGSWASKGIIAPLDEYIESEGIDLDDFVPAAIDQMTYEDSVYALPIAVHSFQLLYNKTLLAEAGVAVPTTMDELATAVAALTKQDADGTITQLGLGDANTSTTLTTLAYAFGGTWDGDKGTEPTPTDEGNIAAMDWYLNNVVEPVGPDNLATFKAGLGEYLSAQDSFYNGNVAMILDGEWRAISAPKVAPALDWGVTAIPAVSDELAGATQVTASTLFIPSNSKHKDEAAAFLAYLVSDDAMVDFTLALGNLPSRTSLFDDPAYADIPNFGTWAEALTGDNIGVLGSGPYASEYSTDLAAAFDDVTRGAASPTDAMEKVASRSESYATK